MDNWDHQREIPRHRAITKKEREDWVEQKKCKSCKHYEFYYCRIQNRNVAPDMVCTSPNDLYTPSDFYKMQVKHDSEEEASIGE